MENPNKKSKSFLAPVAPAPVVQAAIPQLDAWKDDKIDIKFNFKRDGDILTVDLTATNTTLAENITDFVFQGIFLILKTFLNSNKLSRGTKDTTITALTAKFIISRSWRPCHPADKNKKSIKNSIKNETQNCLHSKWRCAR